MSIVKAFIGGLVGAVIATVALMFLRDGSMQGYEWFPLVTGLLTGLGARMLTGRMGRSLATGIVAAVISMVTILAGGELLEMLKMRNMDLGPVDRVVQKESEAMSESEPAGDEKPMDGSAAKESVDGESAEDHSAGSDDSASEQVSDSDPAMEAAKGKSRSAEVMARAGITPSDEVMNNLPPAKPPESLGDFLPYVFSGLGVLIAYQLARGTCSKVDSNEETPATADAEQPAAS